MTNIFRTVLLCSVLGVTALNVSGCAALKAAAAKHQAIDARTREHVYDKPLSAVWPEARKMLFEEGFEIKDLEQGEALAMETEPKYGKDGSEQYLVQGIKLENGTKCKVEFTKVSIEHGRRFADRDLSIEWELLQRIDPAAAQKINTDAAAVGERALAASK